MLFIFPEFTNYSATGSNLSKHSVPFFFIGETFTLKVYSTWPKNVTTEQLIAHCNF